MQTKSAICFLVATLFPHLFLSAGDQSGKTHVKPASVFDWEQLVGDDPKNPDFELIDKFIAGCTENKEPFCLLLCSNEPHRPWNKGDASRYPAEEIQLPKYLLDTPEPRRGMSDYLAEVTYFDSQVGQAIELLDRHQISDETLLMVVSEQGNSLPFAKWTCYGRGLQSACIARWPGHVKPGIVNPAMIEYVDFLPTFIEVVGGESESEELDGISLVSVLSSAQTHKKYVFADPLEMNNLAGDDRYAAAMSELRSELDQRTRRCGDQGQPTEANELQRQGKVRNSKKNKQ